MLSSKIDLDNRFDDVVRKSFPFLILAPKDFREKLVELLAQFNHYYNEREETAFKDKYENICSMLETAEFDQLTDCDIYQLGYKISSTDQKINDINRRLTKIEEKIGMFNINAGKLEEPVLIDITKNRFTDISSSSSPSSHTNSSLGSNVSVILPDVNQINAFQSKTSLESNTSSGDNNIDLVYNYLSNHPGVHNDFDLAAELNLTKKQVNQTVSNIFSKSSPHKEKLKHIKKGIGYYKPNPDLRPYPHKTYQWVENLEKEDNTSMD